MRIQSSKILDAQMRALGAIPQVMAFSEVYQALQTGVVDGTENPPSNLYTQKMFEVQKYVTISDHGYLGYAVIVNKKFWEGLPADIRTQLESAMADATIFANNIAKKKNEEDMASVKASGKSELITLTPEERAEWKTSSARFTQDGKPYRRRSDSGSLPGDRLQEIRTSTSDAAATGRGSASAFLTCTRYHIAMENYREC